MSTTTHYTADELLAMPTGIGKRYELVAGELREMSPSGWRHGTVISNLHERLSAFNTRQKRGRLFGAETGFRIEMDPDTVRAPDIAFIGNRNLPAKMPEDGFWPGAPDLVVEVLSPSDRTGDVDEKIEAWLNAGCTSVWIVDPKLQTVTVYHSRTDVRVLTATDSLQDDAIVPGFSCAVAELFG